MTKTEATARYTAASARISAVSPKTMVVISVGVLAASAFRAIVHLCIGFGAASLAHVSAWWGLPVALLSAQTIGRLWKWLRRDAFVLGMEKAADDVEKRAGVKS